MPVPALIADPRAFADFLQNAANQPTTLDGHIGTIGPSPTVAAGAQAASASLAPGSTDMAGAITFTTVGAPGAGVIATVTFARTYSVAPVVVLTWQSSNASPSLGVVVQPNGSGFQVTVPAALAASTSYTIGYVVVAIGAAS